MTSTQPHWWQLSGIQKVLLFYVLMPLIVIAGLGLGIGLERLSSQESDRLKDDLELIGRAIRLPIGEALSNRDEEAVSRTLQSVFTIGRVYGASVFDANGNLVASAGLAETDLTRSEVAREVVLTGEQQDQYREVLGTELYSYFIPVTDASGIPNGFIQINRRARDFDRSFERLSQNAWLIWGGISFLMIGVVVFGHYRGLGRFVSDLRDVMTRVEYGSRKVRASTDGPEEIAAIARGLNRMLDSIDRKDQELLARQEHEHELSEQLQSREKMAAIGRVASGIAHELGAPLTVIDGRARRLEKSLSATETDSLRQLGAIRGQVGRLTRIVRQLLNYTREEAQESLEQSVQLEKLLHEAVESVRHEITHPAVHFDIHVTVTCLLAGRENRLELAFVNVLRNAAQAAKAQVSIEAVEEADECVIRVQDDGPGISDELEPEKLLEPFVTTKSTGEGTGLGLAITHQVITEHGGSLSLRNLPMSGCEVEIRLPLKPRVKG
ncbi:MAG: two component signal transduction system histidine kinase [Idiomarinaceae bacterium HL-53]|nr:MAG: two component signal transduction system histidine kinase [Idiomarinaceae bacterium HL-53]CUS47860.1 His Kinase A (phospho-acceptor) domain-containing protein [Idiomarinaceae bacterium HL-53]